MNQIQDTGWELPAGTIEDEDKIGGNRTYREARASFRQGVGASIIALPKLPHGGYSGRGGKPSIRPRIRQGGFEIKTFNLRQSVLTNGAKAGQKSNSRRVQATLSGTAKRHSRYITRPEALEPLEPLTREYDLLADMPEPPENTITNMGDNPEQMWDKLQKLETRQGARIQYRIIVDLPHELSPTQRQNVLKHYCRANFEALGLPYQAAIHTPPKGGDERNFHAHIIYSDRPLTENGFAKNKSREVNARNWLFKLRGSWAAACNHELRDAGSNTRMTASSYARLGVNKQPSQHLGQKQTYLERKGIETRQGKFNSEAQKKYETEIQPKNDYTEQRRLEYKTRLEFLAGLGIDISTLPPPAKLKAEVSSNFSINKIVLKHFKEQSALIRAEAKNFVTERRTLNELYALSKAGAELNQARSAYLKKYIPNYIPFKKASDYLENKIKSGAMKKTQGDMTAKNYLEQKVDTQKEEVFRKPRSRDTGR